VEREFKARVSSCRRCDSESYLKYEIPRIGTTLKVQVYIKSASKYQFYRTFSELKWDSVKERFKIFYYKL
jgi:hypothetical protein